MWLAWAKWKIAMYLGTILTALFVQQSVMPGFGFTSQLSSGAIIFPKIEFLCETSLLYLCTRLSLNL